MASKRKIDEQISYNWLFFLLAGGFAAVTVWAVYDETATRREYKHYQESFFQVERDLNHDKVEALRAELKGNERYKALEVEEAKIKDGLATAERKAEIARAQGELEQATFAAFDATQAFTFSKSEMDEAYYYARLAKHDPATHTPAVTKAAQDKLEGLQKRNADDSVKMAAAEAAKKDVQRKYDDLVQAKRVAEIRKELETLERPVDDAERALAKSEARIAGLFGPGTEVIQQNLPEIEKVDRCESCHLGAARGGFETVAQLEFKSHPMRRSLIATHPPEKFGCTTCHDGQGRATAAFFAHAPSAEEDAHAYHEHYWEFPLLKGPPCSPDERERGECNQKEYMESKCLGCHQQQWSLRSTLPCEIDAECPSSPEGGPMICEAPRVVASDDAPYASVALADEAAAQAADKAAPAPKVAKFCLALAESDVEKLKKGKIELANADHRKKLIKNATASLVDLAPNLSAGLRVIEESGCYGCHPIVGYQGKPKPAPSLTRLAHKLTSSQWLVEWIEDPKVFRPNTRMPRFWPEILEPNAYPYAVDVDAIKTSRREEATAIAAFLLTQSKTSAKYPYALEAVPAGVTGDAERGKVLLGQLGCASCHNIPAETGGRIEHPNRATHFDYGPDLTNVGAKTSKEWIYSWVRNPRRYSPETRMPNLRLDPQEAADLAEYLSRQTGGRAFAPGIDASLSDPKLVEKGKDLVKYRGCFGCHMVEGYELTPGIGAELTEFGVKTTDRLDYGDYITDHNQQTWDAWAFNKLKHPRIYAYDRAVLRMPQFDLTNNEVRKVMVVLKGLRGESLETKVLGRRLSTEEQSREQGRELVRLFNCNGCHTLDGRNGAIAGQVFKGDELANNGPPNLVGEGRKTQPEWLFGFLKNPTPIRPLVFNKGHVRMPTFGFTDDQASALVAMFSSFDGAAFPFRYYADLTATADEVKVASAVYAQGSCVKQCHVIEPLVRGQALPEDRKGPNLLAVKDRLRGEWVTSWLADPKRHLPYTAMPSLWAGQNQLELALKDPALAKLVSGMDQAVLGLFRGSRERQIEALRNFLWTLTPANAKPAATSVPAATPTPAVASAAP